jgi:hypothetical protein
VTVFHRHTAFWAHYLQRATALLGVLALCGALFTCVLHCHVQSASPELPPNAHFYICHDPIPPANIGEAALLLLLLPLLLPLAEHVRPTLKWLGQPLATSFATSNWPHGPPTPPPRFAST